MSLLAEIDDDGSGKLDNKELVQAWLKATGEDITPEQSQTMIDEVDEDKNGTLDQEEFIALIRKRCEQPLRSYADQFSNAQLLQIFECECSVVATASRTAFANAVAIPCHRLWPDRHPGHPHFELNSSPSRSADTCGGAGPPSSPRPCAVYDDDGNNEMDADELVVAWKKVTDKKITTQEAQALINQGATNGNSTLDKDEFVQLVRSHA